MIDSAIKLFESIPTGILAAMIGAAASLLSQYFLFRYRLFKSAKRFNRDMANLTRHIQASLNSLDIDAERPRYFISARIRFCKFLDGVSSLDDLEWLTRRKDSDRILPTLLAIRNSDTFLEEIASRIEKMSSDEISLAIADAKLNLEFLQKTVERLGYDIEYKDQIYTAHFARDTLEKISDPTCQSRD